MAQTFTTALYSTKIADVAENIMDQLPPGLKTFLMHPLVLTVATMGTAVAAWGVIYFAVLIFSGEVGPDGVLSTCNLLHFLPRMPWAGASSVKCIT